MRTVIGLLDRYLGRPRLVEFEYQDSRGHHHGRCYVKCLGRSQQRIERALHGLGYTNVRID